MIAMAMAMIKIENGKKEEEEHEIIGVEKKMVKKNSKRIESLFKHLTNPRVCVLFE